MKKGTNKRLKVYEKIYDETLSLIEKNKSINVKISELTLETIGLSNETLSMYNKICITKVTKANNLCSLYLPFVWIL